MSKAVKAVTKAVGGVAGGLIGGTTSEIADKLPGYTGKTREIDKTAFKVDNAQKKEADIKKKEEEAAARSKTAQSDRASLLSNLKTQAQEAGSGPSLAEAQLKSASDRSLAQQLAAAQSQRGGNAAATQRQLLRGQAQAGRELAQDSATARLQEQQQNQQFQLGTQQLMGQQIGQEQQLADQLTQQYLAQGLTIDQARQQAAADYEKLQTQQFLAAQGLTAQGVAGQNQAAAGIFGGLAQAGGSMMAASDKNTKKKVKKAKSSDFTKALEEKKEKKSLKEGAGEGLQALGSKISQSANSLGAASGQGLFQSELSKMSDKGTKKDIKKGFLDKLQAYTYEYKDKYKSMPEAGKGTYTSVMAQDLEKAGPIGKSMVQQNEDGIKVVDYAKGYGAILAAQAHLNKRLDKMEKKSKKSKK